MSTLKKGLIVKQAKQMYWAKLQEETMAMSTYLL